MRIFSIAASCYCLSAEIRKALAQNAAVWAGLKRPECGRRSSPEICTRPGLPLDLGVDRNIAVNRKRDIASPFLLRNGNKNKTGIMSSDP